MRMTGWRWRLVGPEYGRWQGDDGIKSAVFQSLDKTTVPRGDGDRGWNCRSGKGAVQQQGELLLEFSDEVAFRLSRHLGMVIRKVLVYELDNPILVVVHAIAPGGVEGACVGPQAMNGISSGFNLGPELGRLRADEIGMVGEHHLNNLITMWIVHLEQGHALLGGVNVVYNVAGLEEGGIL